MTAKGPYQSATIAEIRANITLSAILPTTALAGTCFVCGDDGFHASDERGFWCCGCGAVGGDVISAHAAIEQVDYLEAANRLAQRLTTLQKLRKVAGGSDKT